MKTIKINPSTLSSVTPEKTIIIDENGVVRAYPAAFYGRNVGNKVTSEFIMAIKAIEIDLDVDELEINGATITDPLEAVTLLNDLANFKMGGSSSGNNGGGGVTVHNQLMGRNAADTHPISAISGLSVVVDDIRRELDEKADKINETGVVVYLPPGLLPGISESDSLYIWIDKNKYIIGKIRKDGLWDINFLPEKIFNNTTFFRNKLQDYVAVFTDKNGRVQAKITDIGDIIPLIATLTVESLIFSNSYPFNFSKILEISSQTIITTAIRVNVNAVGKLSSDGADDAPVVPLTYQGIAHPSVVYHPSGWNGYKYWMAFTPYFLVGAPQTDPYFENPTILCSEDGIEWIEPNGIINPVDRAPALPNTGYWSDTHLKLGNDGMLHLWYRGNYISPNYTRHVVHRKSRDGINWSETTTCYSTSDAGLMADNQIVSPAFELQVEHWNCFDVIVKSTTGGLAPEGNIINNQTNRFVIRRISHSPSDWSKSPYSLDSVVNFVNRPWGNANDAWHLDAQKYGNIWFLLLAVGDSYSSASDSLWLAYSGDGWNFKVLENPVYPRNVYRSCMIFKPSTDNRINIDMYIGNRSGYIELHNIKLSIKN